MELYDGRLWQPINPMRHRRHSFATAVLEHTIYAAGGIWGGVDQKLNSVEYYSSEIGSWTVMAMRMTKPRAYFQIAVIEDKMYAVGGDEISSVESVDSMDRDGQWSTGQVYLPFLFQNHTSVALNRTIYVVGWFFDESVVGQLRKLPLGDVGTSFVANLPPQIRFDGARITVLKMRPCDVERARDGS